jgi:drug/metabolite transporter (DMT)-like permease
MVNNVCVVIALRHLSLTLFYILVFMSPMVIALLSAIFLREGLPWRRAAAIAAGFTGVVIAVNPFGLSFAGPGSGVASGLASGQAREGDWIGYTACLVCVACFSVNMVWSRVLTRTEKPESLTFFSGLVTAVIGFALLLLLPEPGAARLTAPLLAGLFAMGLFCALGTLCFYIAVKHTSAANVSQYHYTQLITGTLLSYWIWHTRPGLFVLLGGTLIFGSGIYIAAEARNAARATEQEAGPEAGHEVVPLTEGN